MNVAAEADEAMIDVAASANAAVEKSLIFLSCCMCDAEK